MGIYRDKKIKIGITLGDPAGIGAEVVVKSLKDFKIPSNIKILLIGDSFLINCLNSKIDIPVFLNIDEWSKSNLGLGILNTKILNSHRPIKYGQPVAEYGEAGYGYIRKAAELVKSGKVDRLITAPVNKKVINLAGIEFTGHTEYLANFFNVDEFAMMLLCNNLRVVLLTRHIPLKEVSGYVTDKNLTNIIRIVDTYMRKFFKLKNVRIGIAGLNPHVGDNGLIGSEEKNIIKPVLKKLTNKYKVKGPLPMHNLVKEVKHGALDVIVCMYHDQGLLPLKLLYPNRGVNLTLGLPFIRTSPVHGTAYDIAGKNKASPDSMLDALKFTTSI